MTPKILFFVLFLGLALLGCVSTQYKAEASASPQELRLSWSEALRLLNLGEVKSCFLPHRDYFYLTLANGTRVVVENPNNSDFSAEIRKCGAMCGELRCAIE